MREFPIPNGTSAQDIATGPDGTTWFTLVLRGKIGRMTRGGAVTEYAIPTTFSLPWGIAAGPDGAMWFTESIGNNIGRITSQGTVTEYKVPTAASFPHGIAAGPDGAM